MSIGILLVMLSFDASVFSENTSLFILDGTDIDSFFACSEANREIGYLQLRLIVTVSMYHVNIVNLLT